jgi:hypothetical protein
MVNPAQHTEFASFSAATGGAVDLAMCHAAGLSTKAVRGRVESGRWQSPYRGVFVTFSGPLPLRTREFAALLYAGPGSALSHDSAGFRWRVCSDPGVIHITTTYANHVKPQPGLVIHRSRTLSQADIHPSLEPRRTRIERTVLDLLAEKTTVDGALSLVADAVRQQQTTAARLGDALRPRPRTRWRSEILTALPDLNAGAHSLLELRDAAIRRRHGLPMGNRQHQRLIDGSEYLDVLIPEWQMHVEYDGQLGHNRAIETWRDMRRDNRSERQQLRHLRYGWADMLGRPCAVAVEQAIILRQQGWRGRFRACPSCPPELLADL